MGFHNLGSNGTLAGVPDESFDPEAAAKKLYDGMKGLGTDENAIIEVLGTHNFEQRKTINEKYKTMYGKELTEDLGDELGGSLKKLVLALLIDPEEFIIDCVQQAIEGVGTDESALIMQLCGRTNAEMEEMKILYKKKFEVEMEEAISEDVSGDFRKLLISLMTAGREEDEETDEEKAKKDAKDLFDAGEGELGTREEVFNAVFAQRSPQHMRAVFDAYKEISEGNEIESAIEGEFSGALQNAYIALAKGFRSMADYYAERVRGALKGAGTDDDTLIQILVIRSEIDLKDVAESYERMYEATLKDDVASDTSGDYQLLLIRILGD